MKRAARPAKTRKLSKSAKSKMNDTREFAKVAVGEGFDPEAPALESNAAMTEAPGFDMAAFRRFVQGLGLRYFSAEELLFMGASNAPGGQCAGKNHFPAEPLWQRIASTARMLDEIRHRLGASCRVLSAYRSPAYNNCIGGESASLHRRP